MPYDHPFHSTRTPSPSFPWSQSVEYDQTKKDAFHNAAKKRLKALAQYCGWPTTSYDLRSNKGGLAVSGEITLHHDHLYVAVSQGRIGGDTGILIRTCKGRRDYVGGPNTFATIQLLDDIPALASRLHQLSPSAFNGGSL